MPKDYKHRLAQAQESPPRQRSCVPRFLVGLIMGLSVAVVVQLYHTHLIPAVWPLNLLRREAPPGAVAPPQQQPKAQPVAQEPKPKLDFYELLPKLKVETAKPTAQPAKPLLAAITTPGSYSIQLGAFQKSEAAEERKARLALLGFETSLVAAPQQKPPVYRVRMGPYQDLAQLNATRQRLHAHGVEFSLSKEK